jgi:AAA domain/UvrD-like helicase C-terminal domain
MAIIHPRISPPLALQHGGYQLELKLLEILRMGLPDNFDVFHGLTWSTVHNSMQKFGELGLLFKDYRQEKPKDIGHQLGRQHGALRKRLKHAQMDHVEVQSFLVMPDQILQSEGLAYPRERVIDATQMDQFCTLVRTSFGVLEKEPNRQLLLNFLSNEFDVVPDVGAMISNIQSSSAHLSNGLATWVPRISQDGNAFIVQATAGSGKTQLALKLLRNAALNKQRALYVCYNRPLADHIQTLAPSHTEVATFHQHCDDYAKQHGHTPDFSNPKVYDELAKIYMADAEKLSPRFDLLVIDESQDFNPEWVDALYQELKDDGRLYVMGDENQKLYERESFDLAGAVRIECNENFRTPQNVVHAINKLNLIDQTIEACSDHAGEAPHFYTHDEQPGAHTLALNECLQNLWSQGIDPSQVVLVTYRGLDKSKVMNLDYAGGKKIKRPMRDADGNSTWTDGELRVETVNRFKGQSAPVVVFCEIDFEELNVVNSRKLFVGMTRGQLKVELVLSNRAAELLSANI